MPMHIRRKAGSAALNSQSVRSALSIPHAFAPKSISFAVAAALAVFSFHATADTVNYDDTAALTGAGLQNAPTSLSGTLLFPGTTANPSASGNTVNVNYTPDGGVTKTNPNKVLGGFSLTSDVTNNTVNLINGAIIDGPTGDVMGGISNSTGDASGNKVNISGGTVGGGVTGGHSHRGSATGNEVTISGGTIGNQITGGVSVGGAGNASGNTVTISGGTLNDAVTGGNTNNGTARNNTVNINSGATGLGALTIAGGVGATASGNTLNKNVDAAIGTVRYFETVKFGYTGDANITNLYADGGGTGTTTRGVELDTNGYDVTFGGVITNGTAANGSITKAGTGTLTLSGANTYSGGTTVTGGLINFSNANNLGTANITLNGGGLQWAAGNTTDISGRLNAIGANGAVFDTGNNAVTLANALSGAGGITKDGAGTLTLSGNNSYTGGTTVSAGSLVVTGALGNGDYAGNVVNNAEVTFNQGGAQTLSGVISGSGNLTKDGAGTLTLSGANTYKGNTTVSNGILNVTGSLGNGNYAGNVVIENAGTLTFDQTGNQSLSGAISGAGALNKINIGTLTLSGTNNLTGDMNVTAGTVRLAGDAGKLNGDLLVGTNGTLEAERLSARYIAITGANAAASIGTLNVSTNNDELKLDTTSASNVTVNNFAFSGNGNKLTITSAAGGDFTFGGGISVAGKGHSMAGGYATPLAVNSLTFNMDDAQAGDTLLNANGKLITTTATKTSLTAGKALSQFAPGDKVTLVSNLDGASDY
ncbi:autotransporter-associated beta strand repeat-containing protein, partial [Oxalobacter sp. OttesenSCG-928-P03]|nr:autotransporter-associated beta strand repeat-containing protein [Oxalobacter sp. OttesenSCG-928-P03]